MKRSDAVKQLKYWMFGASNNPAHQKEAEALMNKIETMGMLPPERTYEDWTGMGTITETDNTWEPE